MLKIDHLSKAFGQQQVLNDISLTIEKSQVIGLAGSSGSGKSTLLRLIQGLEQPDQGNIESSARTGFIFQDFQLFLHMTVWENITYAVKIKAKNQNYIKKTHELTELLGLAEKINAYPHQLSGGQKQRVALARTLIMEPDILLCDEPNSGLDFVTTQNVIALVESVREMGVGVVIASHDLDFLTKAADKIFVLKNGKLTGKICPKKTNDPINQLKKMYTEMEPNHANN